MYSDDGIAGLGYAAEAPRIQGRWLNPLYSMAGISSFQAIPFPTTLPFLSLFSVVPLAPFAFLFSFKEDGSTFSIVWQESHLSLEVFPSSPQQPFTTPSISLHFFVFPFPFPPTVPLVPSGFLSAFCLLGFLLPPCLYCCYCCRVISVFLLLFIDVPLLLRSCYCSLALRSLLVFPPFFPLRAVFSCVRASIRLTGAWWRLHAYTLTEKGRKRMPVAVHITTSAQDIRL